MKKCFYILLLFFYAIPSSFAQLKIYTFEEAEKLSIENPKPLVVFIHTSWCNYCKMMENSTFKNPEIINVLNSEFYFIPLDAETKNEIYFNNHTFKFIPNGTTTGLHELAISLATIDSQLIYPTTTIIGADYSILFQKHSFINAEELHVVLKNLKE